MRPPCVRPVRHSYAPLQVLSGDHHTRQRLLHTVAVCVSMKQHCCCQLLSFRASSCPTLPLFLQQQYGDDPQGNKHPAVLAQYSTADKMSITQRPSTCSTTAAWGFPFNFHNIMRAAYAGCGCPDACQCLVHGTGRSFLSSPSMPS